MLAQIWPKNDPKWAQNKFFSEVLSLVFLGNNLKWELILLLIFHHLVKFWFSSQNAVSQ